MLGSFMSRVLCLRFKPTSSFASCTIVGRRNLDRGHTGSTQRTSRLDKNQILHWYRHPAESASCRRQGVRGLWRRHTLAEPFIVNDDIDADLHALVTNEYSRAGHEFANVVLGLAAKGTLEIGVR